MKKSYAAQNGRTDWAVAGTVNEPAQLVVAYAAHYLALGAREVFLYLDSPQPDIERLLGKVKGVHLINCDDTYWNETIGRPRGKNIRLRQLINTHHAYTVTNAAWLGHFDADEFAHSDVPIEDLLGALPQEVDTMLLQSRERCFFDDEPQDQIFDGGFRPPAPDGWDRSRGLYGSGRRFLRSGLLGHAHGKSFTRTGLLVLPGIHTPRRPSQAVDMPIRTWQARNARLLHFDGLTALHWAAKLTRAVANGEHHACAGSNDPHRAAQMSYVADNGGDLRAALQIHRNLKSLPAAQAERLRLLGMLRDYPLDIPGAVAALGLGDDIDLSAEAFDRALACEHPELEAWLDDNSRAMLHRHTLKMSA